MQRKLVCLLFALLLLCSVVGLRNIVMHSSGTAPQVLAIGSAPVPPTPPVS